MDSPALRTCSPEITALDLAADELGRRLSGLLHRLLEGSVQSGSVQVVRPRLMIRASTSR